MKDAFLNFPINVPGSIIFHSYIDVRVLYVYAIHKYKDCLFGHKATNILFNV